MFGNLAQQEADRKTRRFRTYCVRFDTSIAAGSSLTTNLAIESGEDFVISDIQGSFRTAATFSSAVAGTPLPRDSSVTAANNTMPTLELVRIQFSVSDFSLFSAPVPASLILGDGRARSFLTTMPRLASNDRLQITATNDTNEVGTGVAIKGTIIFVGYSISVTPLR